MKIDLSKYLPFDQMKEEYAVSYEQDCLKGHAVKHSSDFTLTVSYQKENRFELQGAGEVEISFSCDRCLKEVVVPVSFSIDRKFDLQEEKDEDGEEVLFLRDAELDTDLLIEEEVFLNFPMKVLCKEDCKGICERCGADLNLGPCSCPQVEVPTKMAEALMQALNRKS